jgi:hypothetical protein
VTCEHQRPSPAQLSTAVSHGSDGPTTHELQVQVELATGSAVKFTATGSALAVAT